MSNEWYTPPKYIEAAREVMGGIDLDPASCALANRTVKATRYYTMEENGLSRPWHGRVWCNPPYGRTYGRNGTTAFVDRLLYEYGEGNVEEAIMLTMMGMYAKWFFRMLQFPVCFLEEKPIFYRQNGTEGKLGFAACCFYLGPDEARFTDVFSQFGHVVKTIGSPAARPVPMQLWEVGA